MGWREGGFLNIHISYIIKLFTKREGVKMSKNLSTWFMNGPKVPFKWNLTKHSNQQNEIIEKESQKNRFCHFKVTEFVLRIVLQCIFDFLNTEYNEWKNEWNGNRLYRQDAKTVKFMDGWVYCSSEMGARKKAWGNTLSTSCCWQYVPLHYFYGFQAVFDLANLF